MTNTKHIFDIAVIGGGGAGQMAALRGVLNHLDTVFFLGNAQTNRKGRAQWVASVENIPGFFDKKRPIPATTKEMVAFVEEREDLRSFLTPVKKAVTKIQRNSDGVFVLEAEGEVYFARYVVLCTGTMDVQPVIQGSIKPILPYANRGDVEYCIRCDGHKTFGKKTAVIGHNDGAAWVGIILKERYNLEDLTILTHGKNPQFSEEIEKIIKAYNIEVRTEEITGIEGDPKKGLKAFLLGDVKFPVEKTYVALGSIVYNDLAKQLGAKLNDREHVVTNDKMETTVSGFYAAGDLVAGYKKQVYTAWDMAVDAVDDIDRRIRAAKRNSILNRN